MSYYRDRSPPRGGPYRREEVTRRVSIMVRNLPKSIAPNDLRYYAEKYGSVKDVYLPKDYHTGEPRGLGFIEFFEERDAEEAVRSMDRMMLGGREINANFAMQGRKRPDDFRGGGGYRGRDRYGGRDYGRGYDRGGYDRGYDRYDRDRDYDRRDRDRDHYSDRRRSRSRSRSRSRTPDRSPARGRSRSPADRSPARARSRSASPERRADSRSPARDYSRSPDRGNSQD